MSYKPRSLFRLLEEIENNSLFLPHIQRPFVWETEQMVRLFDSLMRGYPIQTLLFWRTKEGIRARRFMSVVDDDADLSAHYDMQKSAEGVEKTFVLDGQQRLQTLYAIFRGAMKVDARRDAEAYFDLTGGEAEIDGGDLLHRIAFAADRPGLTYYRVRDLTERDNQKDAGTLGEELNEVLEAHFSEETPDQRRAREKRVRKNVGQLVSLLREEKHFWAQELDGVANDYTYRTVLDIFVRVNSGGTKLSATDLMFAAMKEGWEDVEEHIEATVTLLNGDGRLGFDSRFPLKCLLLAHGQGAEDKTEKFTGARGEALLKTLEDSWDRADAAFHELRDFITQDLRVVSDKVVRSYNAFIPLFDFLFHNTKPNEASRARMRAYYYKAQLFGWYAKATDSVLDALHDVVGKTCPGGFPLDDITAYFGERRGFPTQLQSHHLSDNRIRLPLLNLVYVERWGTSPFDVRFKGNEPHVDHIYPQGMLRTHLGQASAEINDIGNLRFLGATDNLRKRAELPGSYFARLKNSGAEIERHLLVPEFAADPTKLEFDVETYARFRAARREAIWRLAKRVVDLDTAPGALAG